MKNLIFTTIIFFSFLIVQNLHAQSKVISPKKNQIENGKELKAKDYYSLSDKQYSNLMNLKGKKEIVLDNGDIVYMISAKQIEVAGQLSREQLNSMRDAYCSIPLEPLAPCENNCRECPAGYFCGRILKTASRPCLETERDERGCVDMFIIQPGPKKCIPLPPR